MGLRKNQKQNPSAFKTNLSFGLRHINEAISIHDKEPLGDYILSLPSVNPQLPRDKTQDHYFSYFFSVLLASIETHNPNDCKPSLNLIPLIKIFENQLVTRMQ
jgi:hypothetical protein